MHPRNRSGSERLYDLLAVQHLPSGDGLVRVYVPGYGRLSVYVDRQQMSGRGIDNTIRAAIDHRRPKPPPTDWSE